LSFNALTKESPASAELLKAAAFLVPDSIPIEIFTLGGPKLVGELAEKLSGTAEDPFGFWELLAPLERYSLVERLPDDDAAFRLHRLTQEVIKDSLGEEGRRDWAERVVGALAAVYPSVQFENWGHCERLQPSARVASELIRAYKLDSHPAGRLLGQAGLCALERGDYVEARFLEEQALEIRERILGVEHPATLISRNNLAAALRYEGDLAGSRRLHEENLEMLVRVLGAEHSDTLRSRNNLAATIRFQGDLAGARRLQEETLEIQERVLGVEHPDTLMSRNNLASLLYSLNDLEAARELSEQVLQARERLLGTEHPATSIAVWNLLTTVERLGDTEAFEQLIGKLRWLLDRDETSIASAQQRRIRQGLLDLLKRA
jgi:tetratricopeptide (TPR) repeat protein